MRNDHKFCDCSALYVTCFKTDITRTYFCPLTLLPESVGRSPTFWVSAYSRGQLIGEEIRYLPPRKMLPEIGDHFVTPGNIQMGEGYGKNSKLSGAC